MTVERILLDNENNSEHIRLHTSRYEFAAKYVIGKDVLDIACGTGYGSAILMRARAKSVLGVDVSPEAVGIASSQYKVPGCSYLQGDALNLALSDKFEVIVSFETIEHLTDPEKFLENILGRLKGGGIFIVSTPVREEWLPPGKTANPFHLIEWNQEEFSGLLAKYFPRIEYYGQYGIKKDKFPLSRTIKKSCLRVIAPESYSMLNEYRVLDAPPAIKVLSPVITYMVDVCRV